MEKQVFFNQDESNIVYFCKHWTETEFWQGIEILYKSQYGYDKIDYVGAYNMIHSIWKKIFFASDDDQKAYIFSEYEQLTLPSENWKAQGGFKKSITFSDIELLQARIVAMCSQIRHTPVELMVLKTPQDIGEMIFKK